MKKSIFFLFVFISAALIFTSFASAQSAGYRGQSISGSTGLLSIPSARVGWNEAGIDFGYRAVMNNEAGISHIPSVTASFFNILELSAAFDIQPERNNHINNDLLLGIKIRLPLPGNTSIAIGAAAQLLNTGSEEFFYSAYQPYIAITYAGSLFNMSAETTVVFGKTLYTIHENNSNIDFGMGFDLVLFPDVFGNVLHWIIDFANYSYSDNSWPNYAQYHTPAVHRGILNTGFRIDLSAIPAIKNLKIIIDFIFNDLFDAGSRSFTAGAVFGFKL